VRRCSILTVDLVRTLYRRRFTFVQDSPNSNRNSEDRHRSRCELLHHDLALLNLSHRPLNGPHHRRDGRRKASAAIHQFKISPATLPDELDRADAIR
jgi:hypothetical protein